MTNADLVNDLADYPAPPEDDPSEGSLQIHGVVLFRGRRWVSDEGTHVMESTEFDLRGVGANWDEAMGSAWVAANDLFDHLADLSDEGHLTDHEQEVLVTLSSRFLEIYRAWETRVAERESKRPSLLSALGVRRRESVAATRQETWDTSPIPHQNSSEPLSV